MALAALSQMVFSEDTSKLILCNIGLFGLTRYCQVSREWKKLADSDAVWMRAVPGIERFARVHVKEYVRDHAVWSKNIEQRLGEFVSQVPLDQKCTFECFFPFNPVCEIVGEFGYGRCCKTDINPKYTEVCIFLEKPLENELRDENLPRIIYGIDKGGTLNVNWNPLEDLMKTPCFFIDFRAILHGDWEERILDKVEKMWSARKDELSMQFKGHQALAW